MLMKQDADVRLPDSIKKMYAAFFLLCIGLFFYVQPLYSVGEPVTITYYLYIDDFAESFIQIPTSNVTDPSTTISSTYLAGRAPIYNMNSAEEINVGTCSASFLCIQNAEGIYTDISNYLTSDDGLIVTWFTPTTLVNLELDSIINGMVTECTVVVTTKVGVAPLYEQTFSLVVSSDDEKIYFQFTRVGMIF